jgi:hypothetical protein
VGKIFSRSKLCINFGKSVWLHLGDFLPTHLVTLLNQLIRWYFPRSFDRVCNHLNANNDTSNQK